MYIDSKVIISGSHVEVYNYERGLFNSSRNWMSGDKRVNLRRLVESNLGRWQADSTRFFKSIFLTLTFKEQAITDVQARHLFRLFSAKFNKFRKKNGLGGEKIKIGDIDERFSRSVNISPMNKYSAVMEYQKRGTPHFHVLYYNLPYIDDFFNVISTMWGHGIILYRIVDNAQRTAAYMTKYMAKGFGKHIDEVDRFRMKNDEKIGNDAYFNSKGLLHPLVLLGEEAHRFIEVYHGVKAYESSYYSKFCGNINYSSFYDGLDDLDFEEIIMGELSTG
jgi:hypothetical protein